MSKALTTDGRIDGDILTPEGFVRGTLEHAHGRIERIEGTPIDVSGARTAGPLVLPGFIDLHVHGGGGFDIMDGGVAIDCIARMHVRHGTTALLATTMTAPLGEVEAALRALAPACGARTAQAARVLGVHLEGPYINPDKLGAQPDFTRPAVLDEIRQLHALAPLRLITLAPEMPGNLDVIAALRDDGFLVQIGHSLGSYEDGVAALERGASGFTHLFNAMSHLHHREPGMAGAALAHARYAEIIPDLLHVHPGAIKVALRAVPCLYCVTDSTAGAGMPDGEYRLGRHRVTKCLGGVRLADGTLAGSTLTMDQALRNLVGLGLDLQDASRRVSTHAANYLGLPERGRLQRGAMADIVVFDRELGLQRVFAEGEEIDLADAG
ncbi:MAG TPA: N-acetylglucosamine-6-phosphate deacetylase [Burkholderiaceae bacterium]|nr:N-acetylglucosamine-6-phosphate deacetylase [Burkholderiaceae bacterium]